MPKADFDQRYSKGLYSAKQQSSTLHKQQPTVEQRRQHSYNVFSFKTPAPKQHFSNDGFP